MVNKRDVEPPAPETVLPDLKTRVAAEDLVIPAGLDFTSYDVAAAGEPHRFGDYEVGEKIDHVDGVTLTDPEHMLATRLWQNTAKVHFNTQARPDGNRLIYGGHVISMARALSFNGLANAQLIAAINGGAHVAPAFAGDTIYAWSEVLDKAETDAPRRRRPPPAARGDQGSRRVDDAARRRREVRRRRAARPRLLGADPRLRRARARARTPSPAAATAAPAPSVRRSRPAASRRRPAPSAPSRAARRRS